MRENDRQRRRSSGALGEPGGRDDDEREDPEDQPHLSGADRAELGADPVRDLADGDAGDDERDDGRGDVRPAKAQPEQRGDGEPGDGEHGGGEVLLGDDEDGDDEGRTQPEPPQPAS